MLYRPAYKLHEGYVLACGWSRPCSLLHPAGRPVQLDTCCLGPVWFSGHSLPENCPPHPATPTPGALCLSSDRPAGGAALPSSTRSTWRPIPEQVAKSLGLALSSSGAFPRHCTELLVVGRPLTLSTVEMWGGVITPPVSVADTALLANWPLSCSISSSVYTSCLSDSTDKLHWSDQISSL